MQSIKVNGQSIPVSNGGNGTRANISTSSTEITAPRAVVERIYALIPGSKLRAEEANPSNATWVFPCENVPNISVSLTIGGDEYTIAAVDMVLAPDTGNFHGDGYSIEATPKNGSCIGLFRSA